MHRRQPPRSLKPSRWQRVGMSIPCSRMTDSSGLPFLGADHFVVDGKGDD